MKLRKQKINWILVICCVFIIFTTVAPIIIASSYSFMNADDFCRDFLEVKNFTQILSECMKEIKLGWFTWQGTYTGYFILALANMLGKSFENYISLIMLTNAAVFMLSLSIFIHCICKYFKLTINQELLIMAMFFAELLGFRAWTESFYWFTGAVMYTFPLSLGFLGGSIVIGNRQSSKRHEKLNTILASILLFLASGGSLEVAAAVCSIMLEICVLNKVYYKKFEKNDLIEFGAAVFGALINTAAPGNYVRYNTGATDTTLHLGTAIISTIISVNDILENLLCNTPFVIVIIISVIIGTRIEYTKIPETSRDKLFFFIIILSLVIVPLITYFPVCLGYRGAYIPGRCEFVGFIIIQFCLIFSSVVLGYIGKESIKMLFNKNVIMILAILIVFLMSNVNTVWRISKSVSYQMWKDIAQNSYKSYNQEVKRICEEIRNDSNDDVFIYQKPDNILYFDAIYLTEDMDFWINGAIARFYGKSSVQYVPNPVYTHETGKNIRIYPGIVEDGYTSIFKVNNITGETETIQELQPLKKNMVIRVGTEENGILKIYSFEDAEGTKMIGESSIEY